MRECPSFFALHGFTGCGKDFDALRSEFSFTGSTWYTPDLHSAGMPREFTALCEALKREWNAIQDSKKILLAYSMGGRIAFHLLQILKEKPPYALILISTSPGIKSKEERAERQLRDRALAQKIRACKSAKDFYDEWQNTPLITSQKNLREPWKTALLQNRKNADLNSWADALTHYGTGKLPSLWEKLNQIPCPTLLITGTQDEKFSKIAQEMLPKIPLATHRAIPNCGHAPQLEAPKECAKEIELFLKNL